MTQWFLEYQAEFRPRLRRFVAANHLIDEINILYHESFEGKHDRRETMWNSSGDMTSIPLELDRQNEESLVHDNWIVIVVLLFESVSVFIAKERKKAVAVQLSWILAKVLCGRSEVHVITYQEK